MDNFSRYVQAFLAVSITLGFFGVIVALFLIGEIPSSVKDILLVMLGALLVAWKEVTGFFFGSTSSSKIKDDTISALAGTPPEQPVTIIPASTSKETP